ncbi:hypothetical protein [Vagococcus lutrae]|uniref:hypothetical protein n=1 Tax=Vagococcus lutrae TaxID=81947 RepID=UPI001475CF1B|nr:hypothetical protein [Vagococcus lutrae]MDT2806495.1 hypothetical protein [Vagococcus lutrae]UQF18187.1 hypothetical protein M2905_05920 [Vagococcus lutrae]
MTRSDTLLEQLTKAQNECKEYQQRAVIKAVIDMLIHQEQRIEQLEGEIDGTLWSPQQW